MSVCDPHRKAHVNRSGTVGDTQQIANDLQRYYVCVGCPEPFDIALSHTRTGSKPCPMQNTIPVVFFSGNMWDPKRKAHVTLAATVGDT